MAEVKGYLKVIITALISAVVTMAVTGAFAKNQKIKNAASKTELEQVKTDVTNTCNLYTDKQLKAHEEKELIRYNAMKEDVTDIKSMVDYMYKRELEKHN